MASRKPLEPLDVGSLVKAMAVLNEQSDRGAALVAAAWLDDVLADLLKTNFRREEKVAGKQEETVAAKVLGVGGALSSFRTRFHLAYLLGLVQKSVFDDLEIIREIRNDFAHFRESIHFTDQSITDKCKNLTTIKVFNQFAEQPVTQTREVFLITCSVLTRYLIALASRARAPAPSKAEPKVDPYLLFVENMVAASKLSDLYEAMSQPSKT